MTLGFIDGEYQDGEIRGCIFVAGKRGMGKTTQMVDKLNKCLGGVVFFDSLSRHESLFPDYKIMTQPGDLIAYLRVNKGRRFRVLYQPRKGNLDHHFRAVCMVVRAIGWMIFAVDELDMLCGSRWGDSRMPPEFYHLVNFGRHERVSMMATARAPMSVARGFTASCCEMLLFCMTEKSHLDYFERYIGAEDTKRLRTLAKYQFLHWRDGQPTTLEGGTRQ